MTGIATLPALTIAPAAAARAYGQVEAGAGAEADGGGASGFGAVLRRAVEGAVDAGRAADRQATGAIAGTANLTDVVTAVSKAELALQTTVTIRDRVVQAYQDIMRMPI